MARVPLQLMAELRREGGWEEPKLWCVVFMSGVELGRAEIDTELFYEKGEAEALHRTAAEWLRDALT